MAPVAVTVRATATNLTALCLAIALPPWPAHAQTSFDTVSAFRPLVVRVNGPDGIIRSGFVTIPQGNGVIIMTLLGATGVAEDATVVDSRGRTHAGRVVLREQRLGLASILIQNWMGPRVVDLDPRTLEPGEQVVIFGFDRVRGELSYKRIRVAGRRRLEGTIPAGFEGGPVVSVTSSRVVGMAESDDGMIIPAASISQATAAVIQIARATPTATPMPRVPTRPATPSPPPAARPGPIIASFPAGASISVDGANAGQTPLRLPARSLTSGVHRITATAPTRLTVTRALTISSETGATVFLPPSSSSEPQTPRGRDLLARFQSVLAHGDAAHAVTLARELLVESPSLPEGRIYQATALWLQGRHSDAWEAVRAHINIHGETVRSLDAYVLLGLIFDERRQFGEALTGYKLAVRVQPTYAREFQQRVNPSDTAIRALARQVAGNPSDVAARIRLGLMYEAKGRFKEGMEEFKTILLTVRTPTVTAAPTPVVQSLTVQTFPRQAFVHVGGQPIGASPVVISGPYPDELTITVGLQGFAQMRRVFRTRGRSDVLFVLLPTLEGYGRTKFAIDNMREGLRAAAVGDWPAATRHFIEALDSDYTLIKLRLYVATGLYMQGRLSEGHEILRAYVNVRNTDTTAMLCYALMGVIREEQSQAQEALTAYKLALKLHSAIAPVANLPPARTDSEVIALQALAERAPDDPRLQYRLGVAFEHKGRHVEGMQAMRRALFSLGTI